jgi:hypothetical protein
MLTLPCRAGTYGASSSVFLSRASDWALISWLLSRTAAPSASLLSVMSSMSRMACQAGGRTGRVRGAGGSARALSGMRCDAVSTMRWISSARPSSSSRFCPR